MKEVWMDIRQATESAHDKYHPQTQFHQVLLLQIAIQKYFPENTIIISESINQIKFLEDGKTRGIPLHNQMQS